MLIATIAGALLGLTNLATADKIEQGRIEAANKERELLFAQADEFTPIDITSIENPGGLTEAYVAKSGGTTIGYVFQAQNRGYAGPVPAMVGIDSEGLIVGVSVLANKETPGLGTKIEVPAFLDQYKEKSSEKNFSAKRATPEEYPTDLVTGATYSSVAVSFDVNDASNAFKQIKEGER